MLQIVLPFTSHDYDQALRWLNWCAELSGLDDRHTLWLMPFKSLEHHEIKIAALKCFRDVREIQDNEGVTSDWRGGKDQRDARGPNSMFRQTAWHFRYAKCGPWFFCEPDCIPLKKDWLDRLEADYTKSGKPFMGVKVVRDNVFPHINGAAIYPQDAISLAPSVATATEWQNGNEVAFDIAGGKEIMRQAHFTNLIHFQYPAKSFTSRAEVDKFLDPEAVMFHSNRDGTLIAALEDAGWAGGQSRSVMRRKIAGSSPAPASNSSSAGEVTGALLREAATFGETIAKANINGGSPLGQTISRIHDRMDIHEQIVQHCDSLLALCSEKPSRKISIQNELRKRHLIPRR